ncbi:MAG: VOC family protein [Burkholderiales bacterium]
MPARPRSPGEFCWFNMLTPDPAAARAFFAQVFEWTYVEMPGIGHIVQVAGHPVGGLFDLASPPVPAGTPPHIGVMVHVADVDAAVARVQALGGTHRPPADVLQQGRMAVCFDPAGANFDLWQPRLGPPTDVDPTLHGAPSWHEAISTDPERATAFYAALFGWTTEAMTMPEFTYTLFKQDDRYVGGLMPVLPHMGTIPSHWGVYFTVRDCDATARQATALGATLGVPPRDIPNVGRFCGIVSPQGVWCYPITYTE